MSCAFAVILCAVGLALGPPDGRFQAGHLCRRLAGSDGAVRIGAQVYCPQEGDLIVFTYRNPLYRLAYNVAGTGPPYHCGIVVRMPNGELATLEAASGYDYVVYLLPLPHRLPAYKGSIWVRRVKQPLTADESTRLTDFAIAQTGKGFAFGRLFLATATPFRPRGPWRYRLFGETCLNRERWFCSELTIAAAVTAGRADPATVRANGIYPRDILLDAPVDLSGSWEKPLLWTTDGHSLTGQPYPDYEELQ